MFEKWKSIPRLNKEVIITEKIDGTNAQIHIVDEETARLYGGHELPITPIDRRDGMYMYVASRKRYITPDDDNFGFAKWCQDNSEELFKLGPGRHYGEWWGCGIQRTYDLSERRLSMFNPKWMDEGPSVVHTVPIINHGTNGIDDMVEMAMSALKKHGSYAAPGFMDPEGVIVYHTAANQMFKTTFDFDEGKWSANGN